MDRENWDDLRYVLAVAETGSLAAAARRLGVNHATVLRHIAGFETRHDTRVFDKTARGYAVSPDNLRLIEAVRQVEEAHVAVARIIAGDRAPLSGTIRVTTTDTMATAYLPGALARLGGQGAGLCFEVLSSNMHVDLGRLHADVTVRPADTPGEELSALRAGEVRFAGFERRAAGGAPDWLRPTGALARARPARWIAEQGGPAQSGADSFVTLASMAAAGLGRAILPVRLGRADPALREVAEPIPPMSVPIWVAIHADLAAVPRLEAARGLLTEALAAELATDV